MAIPDAVFSGSPHRLTMGLRPLSLDTWLDSDPAHPQRKARDQLLAERRDEVYASLDGHQDASAAVAVAVADQLGVQLPPDHPPLVAAAGLVRDDICVLAPVEGRWLLVSAVVCFPSRWRLADKMGRDVLAIHDPVPGYREQLGQPTVTVFDRPAPRWRLNWTLLEDPELFQPEAPTSRAGPPDETWFLRVERQCVVPVAGVIAFTIRTDVVRVADLDAPKRAAILQAAASTPADVAAYRGWTSR